jgi:hypothetical protein
LSLILAAVAIACFATSCQTTDDDIKTPASSGVWRISPGQP